MDPRVTPFLREVVLVPDQRKFRLEDRLHEPYLLDHTLFPLVVSVAEGE